MKKYRGKSILNKSPSPSNNMISKMPQITQQPGFITSKNNIIMEMPNNEEIMSNPKSREQSQGNRVRNNFGMNNENDDGMMQSRYKLDPYDTIDKPEEVKVKEKQPIKGNASCKFLLT